MGLLNKLRAIGSQESSETNADRAKDHLYSGMELAGRGQHKEALKELKQALRITPDDNEVLFELADVYRALGRPDETVKCYEQIAANTPDDFDALNRIGLAHNSLGNRLEAIKAFLQVIRIKPDQAEAYSNLGMAYYSGGLYAEALRACKKALQINPFCLDAHYAMGLVYIDLRDRDGALEAHSVLVDHDQKMADQLLNEIDKEFRQPA